MNKEGWGPGGCRVAITYSILFTMNSNERGGRRGLRDREALETELAGSGAEGGGRGEGEQILLVYQASSVRADHDRGTRKRVRTEGGLNQGGNIGVKTRIIGLPPLFCAGRREAEDAYGGCQEEGTGIPRKGGVAGAMGEK